MTDDVNTNTLLDAVATPLLLFTQDDRLIFANAAALELTGYAAADLAYLTLDDLIAPESSRSDYRRANKRELRLRAAGSRWVWTEFTTSDAHEGNWLATIYDISQRRQIESTLRDSQKLARLIARHFPHGWVAVYDRELNFTLIDGQGLEDIGYSRGELEGKNILDFSVAETYELLTPWLRGALAGRMQVGELPLEGYTYRLQILPVPNDTGEVLYGLIIALNVTEHKRSMEQFQKYANEIDELYNDAPCGYHSLDAEGVFLRVNDTELKWLGYGRYELVNKKRFSELLTPASQELFRQNFARMKAEGVVQGVEYELVTRAGQVLPVLLNAIALYDANGQYLMSQAVIVDITQQKHLEKRLRASEERLRLMVENLPIGAVHIDLQDHLLINRAAEHLLGYDRSELSTLEHWFRTLYGDRHAAVFARYHAQRTSGFPKAEIAPIVRKDGQSRLFEFAGYKYEAGEVWLMRDVTLELQAQRAEREQHLFAEALLDTATALNSTLRLDEVLDRILGNLGKVIPHDSANIMLIEDGMAQIVRLRGYPDERVEDIYKLRFALRETANLRRIVATRRPVIIADTRSDPQWVKSQEDAFIACTMGAPIILEDNVIGFINVNTAQPDYFDALHAQRLLTFATQAAIAIKNARAFEQAQELAAVEERQRLARDLHDAVSQTLFSASVIAESLPLLYDRYPQDVRPNLEQLSRLTRGAVAEMRTLLFELRPAALADTNLSILLGYLVNSICTRSSAEIVLTIQNAESLLPADVKIALYRIAQEALNNAVKHARAQQITVHLAYLPKRIKLEITDDGQGFNIKRVSADRMGLRIMRERAEQGGIVLAIDSAPNRGAVVSAVWRRHGR
ncbi:MAG: PAS domain S-box protein [Chloroflexi bacterium]|nr:PAS domain S-box protein [Chloroflexota bacterium]